MTLKLGGSNKACAACKYQRRRCSKDCPLAPYFPSDKPKMFSNAHRLFGVSNIMRILKQVEPDERDEAMKSIIFESDIRAKYPEHGCYGVIMRYQGMLHKTMEELHYVQTLLALYKEKYHSQHLLPLSSMDQSSLCTNNVNFPMFNNGEAASSSFDGSVVHSCGPYVESMDIMIKNSMKTAPCSVVTDVNSNLVDTKPKLMSRQVDIATDVTTFNANSMDSRYTELSDISNVCPPDAIKAKSNMMLALSYDEQLDDGFTDANVIDAKCAKFDLMDKEGLSSYNELDIPEYDDDMMSSLTIDNHSSDAWMHANSVWNYHLLNDQSKNTLKGIGHIIG